MRKPTTTSRLLIQGRDGFAIRESREHGAYWLCIVHEDVAGGLTGEWSDCETEHDRRNRARRMLARARREYPELRRNA